MTAIADYKAEGFSGGNDRLSAAAPEAVPFVLMLMRGPVARDPLAEAEEAEIVRPEPGRKALPAG